MPDITITVGSDWSQRFLSACNALFLGHYAEDTGNPNPTASELAEYSLKRLGRKFILHYERKLYDEAFDEADLEELKDA